MPIEDLWPGKKASGLLRALYNIAVNRLSPGHPPARDEDVTNVTVDGRQTWVRLYGSANPGNHYLRLGPSVAEGLRDAAKAHPGEPVRFLALWRDPKATDRVVHTWDIPAAVVDQMDTPLPGGVADARRNLRISRDKADGRWYWRGRHSPQRIDLTSYYTPWNLDDEELEQINEQVAAVGAGQPPAPDPDGSSPEEEEEGEEGTDLQANDGSEVPARPLGINKIYFGPPGAGKTWSVNAFCEGFRGHWKFATTFHPEYTYHDFVGSYKPVMAYGGAGGEAAHYRLDDGAALPEGVPAVVYRFIPGVLTNALTCAFRNAGNEVFLIIDEINRGNCAAIFGDVFQLLDRVAEPGPTRGRSRYGVQADPEVLDHMCREVPAAERELRDEGLRLPPNLHLLATMNTSDQSLFPMDSAFKRRWEWEYVPINYEEEGAQGRTVVIRTGADQYQVPWVVFLREVNLRIAGVTGSDDKQIGLYFVPLDTDVTANRFLNKVLFYLWSDVFRHSPAALFANGVSSYDELVRHFLGGGDVFNAEFLQALRAGHSAVPPVPGGGV